MTDAVSPAPRRASLRSLLAVGLSLGLAPALLFASAGRLDWWRGWAWTAFAVAVQLGSRALLARRNPELAAERAAYRRHEEVPRWDRILVSLLVSWTPMATLVVAGLDERLGWRPELSWQSSAIALAAAGLGAALGVWAMSANPFFSAVVRLQEDRGQTVCRSGPYRFVRHPGYAGGVLTTLASPIALGSLWALVPSVVGASTLVVRTALEDRFLHERLDGYRDYAASTSSRLVPGVW